MLDNIVALKLKSPYLFAGFSLCFTALLFFADEGYYNFDWTLNKVNWMIFFVYAGVIFFSQFLLYQLFYLIGIVKQRKLPSLILGTILGLWMLIAVVFA